MPCRLLLTLLALLCPLVAPAAPVPKEAKARRSDEASLEGTWEIVSVDTTGSGPDELTDDFRTFRLTYKAGVLSTGTASGPGWKGVAATLDPAAAPPVLEVRTPRGFVAKTIYDLDGDTLRWCEWQKAVPPDNFDGGKGKNSFLLRRVME